MLKIVWPKPRIRSKKATARRYAPTAWLEWNNHTAGDNMNADSTNVSKTTPIWNPNAIANWSLLLSPIFGAWLSYLNWQTLGEADKAATSRYWLAASILWITAIAIVISLAGNWTYRVAAIVGYILLLSAWYLAEGRKQNSYIKSRFSERYLKRGWQKPLTIALPLFMACQLVFWGIYAGMVSNAPQCTYEHTVGGIADYRTETWTLCWQ